jgi:LuxR family transcriptional regulator, maltose regulon positive regulatory protein
MTVAVQRRYDAASTSTQRTTPPTRPVGLAHGRPAATGMPLLAGKLVAPSMPDRMVARPRLFELLDTGIERPVTLVAAPAGSGKTMLLTSWMSTASLPGPVAWLSLDRGDNDPVRFWTYLLAALCRSGAVPDGSGLPALVPSAQGDDTLLPLLVQGLQELAAPVVLVLDDVHELTEPRVLQGIEFLVRHAPPQLRLVLSTRADPPLPLQRLLVSGRLTQLRGADLAFTVAEAAELLAEYDYRPGLSGDDLAMLRARTEGWAAGLRLAAVAMQHHPDRHRYVMELAGDDRSLAGYLVSEVLEQQPAELRAFLLQTCIVDEMSGELADALTGRDDGERTLARLERANAFVVALGSRREWYRCHPLFAELLRYQLRREAPQEVPELHRRAARWYAGHELPMEAIQQSIATQDWGSAADLVAQYGFGRILRGKEAVSADLLDRLPTDAMRHPELALLAAAEQMVANDDGAAAFEHLAQEQASVLADDRRPRFALILAICRLLRARQSGDLDEVLVAGHAVLEAYGQLEGDAGAAGLAAEARAVALSDLGTAELWSGDLDVAGAHLRAGRAAALWAGLDDVQLDCLSQMALLHAVRGRLDHAVQSSQSALQLAGARGSASSAQAPVTGALLALAWVNYLRDDLATAADYLDQTVAAAGAAPERPLRVAGRIVAGRLRHAQADLAGAFAELSAARHELAGWHQPRLLLRWLTTSEAELHLAVGDTGSARRLLETLETGNPAAQEAVAFARLQLAEGNPTGATSSLSPLVDGTMPTTDLDSLIQAWLLHAVASHALDTPDQVAASLAQAIDLAEPEEHRRVFLDAGAPAHALLARYRDWVHASWPLLDELAQASLEPARTAVSPMPVLIEALSERERAVLRYLPTMLTFIEIGSELYISVNTTKSHVRSIYRKLGVVGRRDAVRRAQQLHLLRS